MENIKIGFASGKDKKQLIEWFKHYDSKKAIEKRVDCYIKHNFTIIAKDIEKDKEKIVGVMQWYAKEDPRDGLAEFEEMFVSEDYRNKGIASKMIEFAIKAVKDYFNSIGKKPRRIFLFVSKNNANARKIYEKAGFKMVSSVGNLFNDNEEELFYSMKI